MKKLLLLALAAAACTAGFSQKGKGKPFKNDATREEARRVILGDAPAKKVETPGKHEEVFPTGKNNGGVWDGTAEKGGPKPSKNQPAKVRQAFAADYPNAANVQWSKYRGDWTATFSTNAVTATAVYHANGRRKDTRTVVERPQLPRAIDDVLRKRPSLQVGNIIRIDLPENLTKLFRVKTVEAGAVSYTVYEAGGQVVSYDY